MTVLTGVVAGLKGEPGEDGETGEFLKLGVKNGLISCLDGVIGVDGVHIAGLAFPGGFLQ